jgi:hypothetical protein
VCLFPGVHPIVFSSYAMTWGSSGDSECPHVPADGALTLRPPTNRPRDILTHTIRPPNILSTVTIFYWNTWPCDIFLLWHSDFVTIFYCNPSTMWHFSTVTFQLCDNFLLWHFDHVTFFYCDIPTLWQFSTVTFCLKVDRLSVHPKKWTFCHTVTFQPTVILANPWLWHFVHFGFWFLPSIPCPSCRWFWQMTISWDCPFNSLGVFRLFFRSDSSFGSCSDF